MKDFIRFVFLKIPSLFSFKTIADTKIIAVKVLLPILLLCGISNQSYAARSMAITGGGNAGANICTGTTQAVIYSFTGLSGSTTDAITAWTFTTTGNAVSGTDITNFQYWASTSATFSTGTATLLATVTTGLGAGAHPSGTFGTSYTPAAGATTYFYITVTIPATATSGNTIVVEGYATPGVAGSQLAYSTSVPFTCATTFTPTGNINPSGTYTIVGTPAAISGPTTVCTTSTIRLSDAIAIGTWSTSTSTVATVGLATGIVTGGLAGTSTITYSNGCGTPATTIVTVLGVPGAISGSPTTICHGGSTTTLSDAATGGTWSTNTTSVATVGVATALVTSGVAGTATISYSNGCGAPATTVITVVGAPGAITGQTAVCQGLTIVLSDATTGGTWASASTTIATVGSANGIVTGVAAGTSVIAYSNGCGVSTFTVTVNPGAVAITGVALVCVGTTTSLSDATPGGTWSCSNTAMATISSTAIVSGVAPGTPVITYTLPTSCYRTTTVIVNPAPTAITGPTQVCSGLTIALSEASNSGTWSSGTASIATVSATGIVTGAAAGTAVISFTNSCGSAVTHSVTVNPLPAPITGYNAACTSLTTTLSDATSGGVWTSAITTIATIGSSTGLVHGIAPGLAPITYTLSTTCLITTTVTVVSTPLAPITGINIVCVSQTTTLSQATAPLGYWSSDTTLLATVNPITGIVTGVQMGTPVIRYTIGTGCTTTRTVTVNPLAPITGTDSICNGSNIYLADIVGGGIWTSINTTVAIIGSSNGYVTGVGGGTSTITYTTSLGCITTFIMSVTAIPLAITGIMKACPGTTTTFADATTGGAWSSDNTGVATVGTSGIVYGVFADTVTINYTMRPGCSAHALLLVNPSPSPIIGINSLCATLIDSLSDTTSGGVWSTTTPGVATINATTGVFGSLAGGGSATFVYTLPTTGCKTTKTITIHPLPVPVITFNGITNTLYVDTGYVTYQWYGSVTGLIPGATSNSIAGLVTQDYWCVVTDHFGCTSSSAVFAYNIAMGVKNIVNTLIKVYPNPANSTVYIQSDTKVSAVISSIDGKILSEQADAKEIDISRLADGMYFIMLYNDDKQLITIRKFIKQ